jgi:hypothetical protein
MTDEPGEDPHALLERLGALPAHDVQPEVRDAIAAKADAILAREARPGRRVARIYRSMELPLLAAAACMYLFWNVSMVASIHRGASQDIAPQVAAGAGAEAAYTATREDTKLARGGDGRDGARSMRGHARRGA